MDQERPQCTLAAILGITDPPAKAVSAVKMAYQVTFCQDTVFE